jgi:uncharacterized repeat protein (TIGR02543 family)
MIQVKTNTSKNPAKRVFALISTMSFALVSALGVSTPANASEMAPIIEFDRNVLAADVVHSELGERPVQYQVALNPAPLKRAMTTNRPGYSFGGWSYATGGPAVTTLQTASHTTTRMTLYAVWTTKLNLNTNGATAGRLVGGESTVDYRFNQDLTLPTGGTIRKKGYSFAGWTFAPNSGVIAGTYRAAADAVGNPTVYAAWKKTINFASRGSKGTVPASITYLEGGQRIALPTVAQTSLTRAGYDFMGWSTTPKGKPVKNATSYLPKKKSITLHAVWKKK